MAPNIRLNSSHRPLAVLARGLAVEIVERIRNVRRHALEQRDDLVVERPGLAPGDEQHADAAAVAGQRQGRRRTDMRLTCSFSPGQRTRVVQVIVADARPLVAKGLSADPFTLGRLRDDRNIDPAQPCTVVAEAGGKPKHVGCRFQQKDGVARKSPLENAASQTCRYRSSGDFAYRIASLVALNAANVRAMLVSKIIGSPAAIPPMPADLCRWDT